MIAISREKPLTFYVVQAGKNYELPVFKIGYTGGRLMKRLSAIQNGCPAKLSLCFAAHSHPEIVKDLESFLKACYFDGLSTGGGTEWFSCSGESFLHFLKEAYCMFSELGTSAFIPPEFHYLAYPEVKT